MEVRIQRIIRHTAKKLSLWGKNLVVYLSPEAKQFGWDSSTNLEVTAFIDEDDTPMILIKEALEWKARKR